jgi:hypothetical protein
MKRASRRYLGTLYLSAEGHVRLTTSCRIESWYVPSSNQPRTCPLSFAFSYDFLESSNLLLQACISTRQTGDLPAPSLDHEIRTPAWLRRDPQNHPILAATAWLTFYSSNPLILVPTYEKPVLPRRHLQVRCLALRFSA